MSDAQIHELVASYLFPALVVFAGLVAYVFGIRPVLRKNPAFKTLYDTEETGFNAVKAKFSGIKQKLTTIIVSAGSLVVVLHDEITPFVTQAGVDPSQILPKVPSWVWPLATIAVLWLVQHFRELADRQARANAEALLNAGHSLAAPAPGIPVTALPSPNPLASLPDKPGA